MFFASATEFRAWLKANHDREAELLVGFHKVGSASPSMTWPESVDEALCYGWIDGVRRSHGDGAYTIRFTPRRPRSYWSAVNIARVEELTKQGRMHEAGLRAFERRAGERSGAYSYENRDRPLDPEIERALRDQPAAWAFFQAQPAWYRRTAAFWVADAKRDATRARRLQTLVEESAAGRRVPPLTRASQRPPAL